jgi:hypothetical protein
MTIDQLTIAISVFEVAETQVSILYHSNFRPGKAAELRIAELEMATAAVASKAAFDAASEDVKTEYLAVNYNRRIMSKINRVIAKQTA